MPITGPSSYLPTTDQFIAHWNAANTALGAAGPIVLAEGATVAVLSTLRATLATQRADIESARNAREAVRAELEALKLALLQRLHQYNGKIRSLEPERSRWIAMLPKAYSTHEGQGVTLPILDDLADQWTKYLAEHPNFALMGGYQADDLADELALLKNAYTQYEVTNNGLLRARLLRNETQDRIYPILKRYRQRIPSEFAEGTAIHESLPRLTPLPGSTPEAAQLAAVYNAATVSADLAWNEVEDERITAFEVRTTAGPEFEAEDETILATFAPGDPRLYSTNFGLALPGTAVSFKLYSLTATGNERGSNAVTVTRPAS